MNCRIEHFVRESVASLEEENTVQQAVKLMADQNVGLSEFGYDLCACVSLLHNRGLLKTSVLHFNG